MIKPELLEQIDDLIAGGNTPPLAMAAELPLSQVRNWMAAQDGVDPAEWRLPFVYRGVPISRGFHLAGKDAFWIKRA